MMIKDLIVDHLAQWGVAKDPQPGSVELRMVSHIDAPLSDAELQVQRPLFPADMVEFWAACSSGEFFSDPDYGQWGLIMLDPRNVEIASQKFARERGRDWFEGDLVIGEFRGDSDLLLLRNDPDAADYGSVVIALPIDRRKDWYCPAKSLSDFLAAYLKSNGEKFWEINAGMV